MQLGKIQKLRIDRIKSFGAYLCDGNSDGGVLLPTKWVPQGASVGDELDVFVYKDSSDRLIATTNTPLLEAEQIGRLTVKDVTRIGAFLDIGLERDVLLPFKEKMGDVRVGQKVLVALYVDHTNRLACTMKIYRFLKSTSPYVRDDEVSGTIYDISETGIFVAVDDAYYGLVPKSEVYADFKIGDSITARVMRVREDGKLDISIRKKAYMQMDDDAERIALILKSHGGRLAFTDKSSPEDIKRVFALSKNAYKRAVGRLLKNGRLALDEDGIRLVDADISCTE